MIDKALMSSENEHWNTPKAIIDLVRLMGPIALDPCSNDTSVVGAKVELKLPEQDGLSADWCSLARSAGGSIYVNPPYGRTHSRAWAAKIAMHRLYSLTDLICLLPARTDTDWFQSFIHPWSAACFLRGRIKFGDATSGAPFPSVVVYYGNRDYKFREIWEKYGIVV